MIISHIIVILIFALIWGLFAVRWTILAAREFHVMAHPTSRGSHSIPTPRLAGVGAAVTVYVFAGLGLQWNNLETDTWVIAAALGGAFALIGGLLDDIQDLNPRWKFLWQFAAAGAVALLGAGFTNLTLWPGTTAELSPLVAALLSAAFIVFMMNAYNFMDGMDGQACSFGTIVFAAVILTLLSLGTARSFLGSDILGAGPMFVGAASIGALVAILFFNRPGVNPASKTFMGDSGSQFFGFLLAMVLMKSQNGTFARFPFLSVLLVISPFAWDVLLTIARRWLNGENILQAHRSHLYQRLLIVGWSHGRVLALNLVLWLACALNAVHFATAYADNEPTKARLAVALTVGLLLSYTVFVTLVERRAKASAHAESS